MNERSFILAALANGSPDGSSDRRSQILGAAFACFAKRGFHQTSMHDISAEAGISVGLIYRYFENKEDVITAMADARKRVLQELMERARQAPSLLEALEVVFTAHCCEESPQLQSAFVLDLYTEAYRNPRLAELVRGVSDSAIEGVTELVANSPEFQNSPLGLTAREVVELIFAVSRGMMMRDVVELERDPQRRREIQLKVVRRIWRLLFQTDGEVAYA